MNEKYKRYETKPAWKMSVNNDHDNGIKGLNLALVSGIDDYDKFGII